jgi:aspartyl aminopeptidase
LFTQKWHARLSLHILVCFENNNGALSHAQKKTQIPIVVLPTLAVHINPIVSPFSYFVILSAEERQKKSPRFQ